MSSSSFMNANKKARIETHMVPTAPAAPKSATAADRFTRELGRSAMIEMWSLSDMVRVAGTCRWARHQMHNAALARVAVVAFNSPWSQVTFNGLQFVQRRIRRMYRDAIAEQQLESVVAASEGTFHATLSSWLSQPAHLAHRAALLPKPPQHVPAVQLPVVPPQPPVVAPAVVAAIVQAAAPVVAAAIPARASYVRSKEQRDKDNAARKLRRARRTQEEKDRENAQRRIRAKRRREAEIAGRLAWARAVEAKRQSALAAADPAPPPMLPALSFAPLPPPPPQAPPTIIVKETKLDDADDDADAAAFANDDGWQPEFGAEEAEADRLQEGKRKIVVAKIASAMARKPSGKRTDSDAETDVDTDDDNDDEERRRVIRLAVDSSVATLLENDNAIDGF